MQSVSGAGYLSKYRFKLGEKESPQCEQCEEEDTEEDLMHLLTNCPAMTGVITSTFSNFPIVEPWCHPALEIVRFLRNTNIDFLPTEQDIN